MLVEYDAGTSLNLTMRWNLFRLFLGWWLGVVDSLKAVSFTKMILRRERMDKTYFERV